jgi:RNA polymerase sigma factor (sigma-70 family)
MGKASVSLDEEPEYGAVLVPDPTTPEELLLGKEREMLVQEAILQLPEPLREVVLLHDYQGMGHQEIAEIVGASYAAVRKRYSRALSVLADLLEDRLG